MDFLEVFIENLAKETKKLYNQINKDYQYDCVIFVARGSYLIGKQLADLNHCPLLEISAKRKGGKLKKRIQPLLQVIPLKLKKMLREREFKSNVHENNYERNIIFNENIWHKYQEAKKILVVDDSVDTGFTIKYVKEAVENFFQNSEVKIAALNVFEKSKKIVKTDFYIYNDTLLEGPWSNDSKENKKYLEMYNNWHINQK